MYQAYLKELSVWNEKRSQIEGNEDDVESLKGLKAALLALDQLPLRIDAVKSEQIDLAISIHAEKLAQADLYRTLYGPVQRFIDTHQIARNRLKLEFSAELINEDFSDRFLNLLALNRKGSFMGVDEGRAKVEGMVGAVKWENVESVRHFLESVVVDALHHDQRENPTISVQLKDQLPKGKKPKKKFITPYMD